MTTWKNAPDENNVKIQNLLDIIKIDVKDRGNVDAGLLLCISIMV
jgi:hypothetical protein